MTASLIDKFLSERIGTTTDSKVASLRTAVSDGLLAYALPVVGETIDGNAVLVGGDGAETVLAYFRGDGPAPAPAT